MYSAERGKRRRICNTKSYLSLLYRGDDVSPGEIILKAGVKLTPQAIGALAAMGISEVLVIRKIRAAIISTGDELIHITERPKQGQIRDVNSDMLAAAMEQAGAVPVLYGIVRDERRLLDEAVERAVPECDLILISGGSSVGEKDATCRVIASQGEVLLHGIAMKPGKPTILGKVQGIPVVGLPGHPGAAFFVTQLLVIPLLDCLTGSREKRYTVRATLTESVGANHGRAQFTAVSMEEREGRWYAAPTRSKSGLITSLAASDGYFAIAYDCEGAAAGAEVEVIPYS